jgi:benzoyl-CoA reductase subunit B
MSETTPATNAAGDPPGDRPAAPHAELIGATRNESRRLMGRWWQEMMEAEERGWPVANVFVMGSMAEVLRAFDIPMSFPEITSLQTAIRGTSMDHLLAAEDHGYSPDICGYVKVDIGLHLTGRQHPNGRLPKPGIVVATNTCNTYIKWSEFWERVYRVPVFVLDLPGWRGSGFVYGTDTETFRADRRYVEGQIRELIALCEQVTGRPFDIDRLREVMGEVNRLAELYQAIIAQNKHHPAPFNAMLDGINYMGIANAWRGHPEGTRFMEVALAELKERVRLGMGALPEERFRLLCVGTACYTHFRRWLELFSEWGGNFVHSEYMTFAGGGLDKGISYDLDRPIESLAEQILYTSQRSMSGIFFSHGWQAEVCREWDADGIVYHGVKSCRTVSTGLPDAREWLMKHEDIPGLFIQSDLVDTRLWADAQMKNRVDAFFEALASRKLAARR